MKKFFTEFKEFIAKGNVMQMAVAFIMGGAFGAIITSLVNDILMPIISLIDGKNVSEWKWLLKKGEIITDPVTGEVLSDASVYMYYGKFIQAIINFLLIAIVLFLIIKVTMSVSKRLEAHKEKVKAEIEQKKAEKTEEAGAE